MAHREGGARTLTYDPGHDAAVRLPDWVIRHHDLRGIPEVLCPIRKVILVERSDTRAGRRCSLAHAIAHIDLEHRSVNGLISGRQELAADRVAARRLINVRHLADACTWAETFEECAFELDVEPRYLALRLERLHPAERHFLRRRLASKEWCA